MTRIRVATVLAVVASLAVLATTAVAGSAYLRRDGDRDDDRGTPRPGRPAAEPLVVRDPVSGATFEVPGDGRWGVKGHRVRIYYTDAKGRPAALVRGPAVFRAGYCAARPRGSNRGFAGFTRQGFGAWTDALARSDGGEDGWSTGVDRERVELTDGTPARLLRAGLFLDGGGRCVASGVEVAMVRAAGVRVVLVRDTGEAGTIDRQDADAILMTLRPGG